MLLLAWQTVRTRKAGFAGAFTALSFALALTLACGVLLESALRAGTPTERYAGASVVISGSTRITDVDPLLGKLVALPDAGSVVPEVSFPAAVITASGQVLPGPHGGASLGHSWSSAVLAPFHLRSGRPPSAPDEVVLDDGTAARGGIKAGNTVRLATTTAPRAYTVTGLVSPPRKLDRQAALFFSPDQAARLAGTTADADAIGITARAGADPRKLASQAAQVLAASYPADSTDFWTGPRVHTGAQRGEAEFAGTPGPGDDLASLAGTVGFLSLFVAIFVVAGALALTVQQRLREMALLRAVGATPRQVRRMISLETLILTLGAALVGCPAGIGVAALLRGALVDRGVVRPDVPLHVGPTALLVVTGVVIVTAQLAVWSSARQASRVDPTQALREAAAPSVRIGLLRTVLGAGTLIGCAVVLSSSAGSRGGAGTAESMVLLLLLGLALLGPVIGRVAGVVVGGPVARLFPVTGFLAAAALRAQPRRFAAAVTPLALAVAFTGAMLFVPAVKSQATVAEDDRRLLADQVVQADGAGLPPDFAAAARQLPGVTAASSVVSTTTMVCAGTTGTAGLRGVEAQVVDPRDLPALLDPGVAAGSLAQLHGDSIALGQQTASALGTGVGSRIRIGWLDRTESTATVVAVYDRDLGFADALLPTEFATSHLPNLLAPTVLVRSAPGADPRQVGRELRGLTSEYPMARVIDRAGYDNARRLGQESITAVGQLLLGLVSLFTAIAVVNTLMMATTERLREFALLRMVGTTRRQVLRMMAWEGGITVGVALVLGTAVSAAVLVPVSLALTGSARPSVPPTGVAGVLGGAALLGLATVLLTTRLVLRKEPVEAMGLRE